jgi:hypothetical protein
LIGRRYEMVDGGTTPLGVVLSGYHAFERKVA